MLKNVGGVPMQQINPPQVDYVAPRVQANASAQLASALDRMAAQITSDALQVRQQEGLQFAAQNPLTAEQLNAAKDGDVSTLDLSANPLSAFGNAVRKARAFELSSHFEIEGRNELAMLLADIENGTATSEQVSNKVATMTNGYGKSLASIDPEAAFKFRATMATHGSTVLRAAYEADLKRAKAARIAKFDADFDNQTRLLEATVSQGFWNRDTGVRDANGQPVMEQRSVDELADVFRQNILRQSVLLVDHKVQREYSDKFELALKTAKVNAVTKEITQDNYMSDPVGTLKRLRAGDVGKMSPVLQQLIRDDFASVAKVEANFMAAINHRDGIKKSAQQDADRAATASFIATYEKMLSAPEGSPERRKFGEQIGQIARSAPGAIPLSIIKDIYDTREGNSAAEFNTLKGIYEGTITQPGQIWDNGSLSAKQKVSLLKTLTSEDRRDQRELDTGLAKLAGIPMIPGSPVVIDPKGIEFQRLQQLRADAQQIQSEATRDNKILTPRQTLLQLEKKLEERRNTAAATAARKQLDDVYSKRDWINGQITRDGLPALRKKAGNDVNKQREITRIEQLLKQAEGEQ